MIHSRRYRCFYCLTPLVIPTPNTDNGNNHDNIRTREHLIPLVDGGDSQPDNVRWSCRACNNYVGCWSLERKLRFRVLVRRVGSVSKLKSMFPKRSANRRIQNLIDNVPMPNDGESHKARLAALRIEHKMVERYKR